MEMETVVERGCGLDVHQKTVVACINIGFTPASPVALTGVNPIGVQSLQTGEAATEPAKNILPF